jgi:hypothetical protein
MLFTEEMMKLVLVLLAVLVSTAAMAEGSSAGHGGGGRTIDFDAIVQQYNQSGEAFRIIGHCQSACTMFLAIRNVCVEPGASLLFHAGNNPSATGRMRGAYNAALSAYLDQRHALDTPAFFTISGSDMIHKFGYRQCR